MDALPRDVIKTTVSVNAGVCLSSDQLNGLEESPWRISFRQVIRAASLGKGKNAARASEHFNLHGDFLREPPSLSRTSDRARRAEQAKAHRASRDRSGTIKRVRSTVSR
jgi:hypothetical protein